MKVKEFCRRSEGPKSAGLIKLIKKEMVLDGADRIGQALRKDCALSRAGNLEHESQELWAAF